jgi:predicted lipoprotein
MSERESVASGEISYREISHHAEGFSKALDKALEDLDGETWAGKELTVIASVKITPNPGGVGQYVVQLVPGGG